MGTRSDAPESTGQPGLRLESVCRSGLLAKPPRSLCLGISLLLAQPAMTGDLIFASGFERHFDLGPIPQPQVECLAVSPDALTRPPDAGLDGTWRQYRRDSHLTGRSLLVGRVTCPQVLWSADLGARLQWLSLRPGQGPSELVLPASEDFDAGRELNAAFEVGGVLIDLDGDGIGDIEATSAEAKYGDLILSTAGTERITCDNAPGQNPQGEYPGTCSLDNWTAGGWQPIWTTAEFDYQGPHFYPIRPIIGDFDNDGAREVAVLPFTAVRVFDLATGALEHSGTFHDPQNDPEGVSGRAYGWFGAFDLVGDARLEFVIIGNFERFISVVGWANGQLTELWERRVEVGVTLNQTRVHTGMAPVADVDGDGRPEIVVSLFNESGDERWHVLVLDGATGAVKHDLADRHLAGLGDLDDDQDFELFVTATLGAVVPEYAGSIVLDVQQGVASELWSSQAEGFEIYRLPNLPDNVNTGGPFFRRHLFLRPDWNGPLPVFVTRALEPGGVDVTLRLYRFLQGQVSQVARVTGPRLEVRSLSTQHPENGILVRAATETVDEGPVAAENLEVMLEVSVRGAPDLAFDATGGRILTNSVVAPLAPGQPPTVVVPDYRDNVRAYRIGERPVELWRTAGRGMIGNDGTALIADGTFAGVHLADVTGDGRLETIVASESTLSQGLVKAVDSTGSTVWTTALDVQGVAPELNAAGITNWTSGHFTTAAREDVLVSLRTADGYDVLVMLQGDTGEVLWRQTEGVLRSDCPGPFHRVPAGGSHMPVFDWDGDGLDEVLGAHFGEFAVYDGIDGATLLNRYTEGDTFCPNADALFPQTFTAQAHVVVADFLQLPAAQLLFAKNSATLALLQLNGEVIWNSPFFDGMPERALQGVGDFDGDGALDLATVGYCGAGGEELQVAAAATGQLRWEMDFAALCDVAPGQPVATGDIDGDGRDEIVFTQSDMLYVVGETPGGQGQILWTVRFPTGTVGYPVIADADGSGEPQVLVNIDPGYLYGIGAPQP